MTQEQHEKIIDNFRIYYNRVIATELKVLEQQRWRLNYLFVFSIFVCIAIFYFVAITETTLFWLFSVVPIGIYALYVLSKIQGFKAVFKPKIVNLILDFMDREIEGGNARRLQEMEQKVQSYRLRIAELQQEVSRIKQKLYSKIEQRLEDIARNLDGGVEQDVIDVVKQRIELLDAEVGDLKQKIAHARLKPDTDSEQRIAEMEAERVVIEKKLQNLKLSLEEGLEEQIEKIEKEIRNYQARIDLFERRMSQRLEAGLTYQFEEKIGLKTFQESGIFNVSPSVYDGEDYIKGYIGSATFEMSELNVMRMSSVRSMLETVFKGIFFRANFYYNVDDGVVLFIPKDERQELSETIRGITRKGGKRIPSPTPEFDNLFIGYATYPVDAGSLLSQEILKAIMDYKQSSGKKIYVSFTKGYVYIAITETKDILEPNILSTNADYRTIRTFFEDILLIVSIVEDFDLNH